MTSGPRPWYVEAFGSLYPIIYAHRSDEAAATEVAFIRENTEIPSKGRILDLACGHGRHLRALKAAGHQGIGLDLSRELLVEGQSHEVAPVVQGDMRRLPFADDAFSAVLSFFTSFGYFPTSEEDPADPRGGAADSRTRRVVRPGFPTG